MRQVMIGRDMTKAAMIRMVTIKMAIIEVDWMRMALM